MVARNHQQQKSLKKKRKPKAFFVDYNGKIMGIYKTLNGALKLIQRKDFKNDDKNTLLLYDDRGDMYDTTNGNKNGAQN